MSDTNIVVERGRLTRNAEMKEYNGRKIVKFSIAVNDSIKNQDGTYADRPNFFDCNIWGKYAEVMFKHLVKGRALVVSGRLRQTSYTNKSGQHTNAVSIEVAAIDLLPNKKQDSAEHQGETPEEQQDNPYADAANYSGNPSDVPDPNEIPM